MSWESGVWRRTATHDVMLPLEIEDLVRNRQMRSASRGGRGTWLLRKAALCRRIGDELAGDANQAAQASAAWQAASTAEAAGRRLLAGLTRELLNEPLPEEQELSFADFGCGVEPSLREEQAA